MAKRLWMARATRNVFVWADDFEEAKGIVAHSEFSHFDHPDDWEVQPLPTVETINPEDAPPEAEKT